MGAKEAKEAIASQTSFKTCYQTQFWDFKPQTAPDPTRGVYSALPESLAGGEGAGSPLTITSSRLSPMVLKLRPFRLRCAPHPQSKPLDPPWSGVRPYVRPSRWLFVPSTYST